MDGDGLEQFVPQLLEARYPGQARLVGEVDIPELPSLGGWMLELEGCILTIRASKTSHPFVWIKGGIAHAIPRSEALALRVATANKDLTVGRLCLACGDDIAMVVFDETVFGLALSLDYQPSVEDIVNRFEASIGYTQEWARKIQEEFDGRPFTADDWHLLTL